MDDKERHGYRNCYTWRSVSRLPRQVVTDPLAPKSPLDMNSYEAIWTTSSYGAHYGDIYSKSLTKADEQFPAFDLASGFVDGGSTGGPLETAFPTIRTH